MVSGKVNPDANSTHSKSAEETGLNNMPNASSASERVIQLPIHFIKSSSFRVIHASGVWYGGDAQQNIHLSFFNERSPIPKKMVINLNERGEVLSEDLTQRETKEGVIREVEVDVILSIPSAVDFYRTLGENLKALKIIK
jgi:hypothetical protein